MKTSAQLPTEAFDGDTYEILAWAKGHQVLYFRHFGSYQGVWLMVSWVEDEYYLWKDWYGSCSGCDSFCGLPTTEEGLRLGDPKVEKFIQDYQPFLEIPSGTMIGLVLGGWERVKEILPRNIVEAELEGYGWEEISKDLSMIVKVREGLEISVQDILETSDQELKQQGLRRYGYERFVQDAQGKELDRRQENVLLGVGDIKLLSVQDSSTQRRYLLRVPPEVEKVKEGIAWTFGMTEAEYAPEVET